MKKYKPKSKPTFFKFPRLKLTKKGIEFYSHCQHRIKIEEMKLMLVNSTLYLKNNKKLIIINNVKDVMLFENYLYFTGLGFVRICFDCESVYRYFMVEIKSKQFSLNNIKQNAILDLMNHNFDYAQCCVTRRYINIIRKVLNIDISSEKVTIKPNKFKLSFVVFYKVNNIIKRVNIRQTL